MPLQSWANLIQEADVSDDKVLDPGSYDLVLKDVKVKQTKNNDPMFNCRYQVESGPYKGTTVWDNIIIFNDPSKQTALRIHLRKLFTLGATQDFLVTDPSNEEIVKKIVGSRVVAELTVSEFGGSDRNDIKSMKANKEAVSAASPSPQASTQAPAPAPEEDTDSSSETEAEPQEAPAPKAKTKARGQIPLPPPA